MLVVMTAFILRAFRDCLDLQSKPPSAIFVTILVTAVIIVLVTAVIIVVTRI